MAEASRCKMGSAMGGTSVVLRVPANAKRKTRGTLKKYQIAVCQMSELMRQSSTAPERCCSAVGVVEKWAEEPNKDDGDDVVATLLPSKM
jgi:hypothetical protein